MSANGIPQQPPSEVAVTSLPTGSDAGDLHALLLKLNDPATQTTLEALRALIAAGVTVSGTIDLSQDTIDAIGSGGGGTPETGLATEVTLQDVAGKLANILTQDTTTATKAEAIRLLLAGTIAVSAASLPLPTGAATQTTLAAILAQLAAGIPLDAGSLAALESITVGGTVELGATSLAALESITATGPLTDTQLRATAVPVSAASLPLPAGAATQTTLAAILAQLAAGIPLDSASLAALETITVGGTVELGATSLAALESITATGPLTDTQLRATAVPVSAASLPLPSGAATQTTLAAILAALAAGIPLDAATLAALESITVGGTVELGSTSLAALESITATGPLTDTQLRASSVPVTATLAAGTAAFGKLAANSGVDIGDVDVMSVIPGTGATNLGKAEDAAHTTGDVGIFHLAVRQAALAALSGSDGDYEPVQTDEVGQVKVTAGRILRSTATITRPADTTAYAASDEISSSTSAPAVVQFTGCARVSGWGGVLQSVVLIDSAGNTAPPVLELWLFDSSVTPDNDNAAFTPTDAEAAKCVAIIPLGTGFAGDPNVGSTGNRVFTASGLGMAYQCSGGTSLYGRLVVRNAYTPISAETFQVILYMVPD